jgi:diacylglycerol kinase family enzyme
VPRADFAFVVNQRSGGRTGRALYARLVDRVGSDLVADIHEVDLAAEVRRWAPQVRSMIACGGDGTVSGLLEVVRSQGLAVPVGMIPLGTGNDLARVAGMPLSGSLDRSLSALQEAVPATIDRWVVSGPGGSRPWYNYCSWGGDARIAQRFHQVRDRHRWFFRSRASNLLAYAGAGLQEAGRAIDAGAISAGTPVIVPSWTSSLVLLNIPSYAGGRSLGPGISSSDGMCDAFALGSGVALGMALSGRRRPRRLGRHRHLRLTLPYGGFFQVDGEPQLALPGEYQVDVSGSALLLAGAASAVG